MLPFVPEVRRFEFEPGYPTSRGTIRLMSDALREFHANPRIVARARSIVAHLPSMDIDSEIRAIWDFVRANVRYVRDPWGAEWVTLPARARADSPGLGLDEQVDLGIAQEDCESIALYAAALLGAIGIPSEFEIQGRRPNDPKRFTHCALRVTNPRTGQKISFDPIGWYEYGDAFGLGDTLHLPGQPIERFSALSGAPTLLGELFGEAFGDAASDLATVNQYGQPIAQGAMAFGPYGAIIGGLFQAGTAIAGTQIKPSQPSAPSSPQQSTITVKPVIAKTAAAHAGSVKARAELAQASSPAKPNTTTSLLAGVAAALLGLAFFGG